MPTFSSMERNVSEFFTAPILAESPVPMPPKKLVVFSAVDFRAVSVFWYLDRTREQRRTIRIN